MLNNPLLKIGKKKITDRWMTWLKLLQVRQKTLSPRQRMMIENAIKELTKELQNKN